MNAGRKKGLGRGLSALFGDSLPKEEVQAKNQSNMVAIADLSRNPYQPRQNFREEKLTELAIKREIQLDGFKYTCMGYEWNIRRQKPLFNELVFEFPNYVHKFQKEVPLQARM